MLWEIIGEECRRCEFIRNVRIYRDRFWDYMKSEDQSDPDNLHVYFISEGASDKAANSNNAAIQAVFAVSFFMAFYISFVRADVK